MFMRLGRIQASQPRVADLYENGDQGQQGGMTSRLADCYYFSTSEGKSDAEVVPGAAGSQSPSVLILRSFLFMENHEKPA